MTGKLSAAQLAERLPDEADDGPTQLADRYPQIDAPLRVENPRPESRNLGWRLVSLEAEHALEALRAAPAGHEDAALLEPDQLGRVPEHLVQGLGER